MIVRCLLAPVSPLVFVTLFVAWARLHMTVAEGRSGHAQSGAFAVKVPPARKYSKLREDDLAADRSEDNAAAEEVEDERMDAEQRVAEERVEAMQRALDPQLAAFLGQEQCEDMSTPPAMTTGQQIEWSSQSSFPECQASAGPQADPRFLENVRPCGNYSSICLDIPLIKANVDYPGGGPGNLRPGQDYIVQFDIGLHPEVAQRVLKKGLKQIDTCMSCPEFEEKCLEVVVTGGSNWGDLGLASLGRRAYDCMGGCGGGCFNSYGDKDAGGMDCLKHDVCSAWKSVRLGRQAKGFCNDPDCGDEAAMTIFNCWRGWRLFGAWGTADSGPFSEPAVCERDPGVRGCWNHARWVMGGQCKLFQGWDRGQGIPDPHPLRSPFQRL